jgi:hypothetical protein
VSIGSLSDWKPRWVVVRPQVQGSDSVDLQSLEAMKVGGPPEDPQADEQEDAVREGKGNVLPEIGVARRWGIHDSRGRGRVLRLKGIK